MDIFESQKERAKEEVKAFWDSMVPPARKTYFLPLAEKHYPDLLKEVNRLKAILDSTVRHPQEWTHSVNRYVVVSKELIRKVSFHLHRSKVP